jgi:hypothetical protein
VPLQNIVLDANTYFISILLLMLAPTGSLHPNTASHSHRSMCVESYLNTVGQLSHRHLSCVFGVLIVHLLK